jgi:hypothetical protein
LIDLFTGDSDYLQASIEIINSAIKTMPFPPADYSGFANSGIGKPLALVNMGYRLELAAFTVEAHNTLSKSKGHNPPYNSHPEDPGPAYQDDIEKYTFPIKIGDQQRIHDGVIG